MNDDEQRLWSSRELAQKFDVTTRTVARWRRDGRIEATVRMPDGTYRFEYQRVLDSLLQWSIRTAS
jgi:predicted site-specific integrase-resolvase